MGVSVHGLVFGMRLKEGNEIPFVVFCLGEVMYVCAECSEFFVRLTLSHNEQVELYLFSIYIAIEIHYDRLGTGTIHLGIYVKHSFHHSNRLLPSMKFGLYLSIAPPSKSIMNLKNPKAHQRPVKT